MDSETTASWPKIAIFVRQLTHDVRNGLNSIDLEASLLTELIHDSEARDSLKRIRAQVRTVAAEMKSLSAKFADPVVTRGPFSAKQLFTLWQEQHRRIDFAPPVEWQNNYAEEKVHVDPGSVADVMRELIINARDLAAKARLVASGIVRDGVAVFQLQALDSPAVDPEPWGHAPFHTTRRGGYGLGLFSARRAIEANGGIIEHRYSAETGELITCFRFPLV